MLRNRSGCSKARGLRSTVNNISGSTSGEVQRVPKWKGKLFENEMVSEVPKIIEKGSQHRAKLGTQIALRR